MKKIFALCSVLIFTIHLSAYDAYVDGIYYNLNSTDLTAEVTTSPQIIGRYKDTIVIPSSFSYENNTYSVTAIGTSAFSGRNITSVTIPNSVTTIGNGAFDGCSGLTSVTIPNSVTTIEGRAFSGCTSLTSVTIGNSVTTIGDATFLYCSGLTSVAIPASVTSIGVCPFAGCDSLTSINVDFNNTHYKSIDGVLFNYAQDTLIQYPIGNTRTKYVIPNTVTTIAVDAFFPCKNLTSVTIPSSVTSIEPAAFANCSELATVAFAENSQLTTIGESAFWCCYLTTIVIPNSVTTIGNQAFGGCRGLTSVTIPNSVTTIGNKTFVGCRSLTSITLGFSVTLIGDSAFYECSRLKTVFNGSGLNITKGSTNNGYVAYYADTVYNWVQVGDFRIRQDTLVEYVGQESNVSIPNEITIIADSAFANCPILTSVVIPNSVETIGESAFANCIYLTDVVLGANVREIGCNAFAGDFRLENITCYAPITPNVCSTTFSGVTKYYVYLYVPADYQRKYQVDPNWNGFSLHLIGAEEKPITGDEVIVTPSSDNVTFTWPAEDQAAGYSIEITKDGVVFCTLKFNAQGQLTGIAFAPSRGGEQRTMQAAEMTAKGWQFTVTGLDQASKYAYTIDALNASQQSIKHYEGEFATDGYTGLDRLTDSPIHRFTKIIKDNRLLIRHNGNLYHALGGKVR